MTNIKTLKDLTQDKKNARKHNPRNIGMVVKAIEEVGVARSGVIDEEGNILAGNGTFEALAELGIDKVKVVKATGSEWVVVQRDGLSAEQKTKLALYDNRTGELADWESEILAGLKEDAPELLEGVFSEDELGEIIGLENEPPAEIEGEDDIPEKTWGDFTRLGDLYQLGDCRLLCGDSTEKEAVSLLMGGQKADMVFTDPPYGINEQGDRSKRNEKNSLRKGVSYKSFKDDSVSYAIDAFTICEGMNIPIQIWWGANYYCHSLEQSNNWLIWDKRLEDKQRDFNSDAELAWVKSGKNSCRIFRHLWKGLIKGSENGQARVHPTQKPIALAEWCFAEYGAENDSVLDLFGGSGSTLIACEKMNRKCYMMELDPQYCDVIVNRYRNLFPEKKILHKGKGAKDWKERKLI
jgi:DNA modification methylase